MFGELVYPWAGACVWLVSSGRHLPQTHPCIHYQSTWVGWSGTCQTPGAILLDRTHLFGIAVQKYILRNGGRYSAARQLLSYGYQKTIVRYTRACH